MVLLNKFIDFILHMDKYFDLIIQNYGSMVYFVLFLVIFLETGFVITPFLPGDSLIFIAGTFSARGVLDVVFLFLLLSAAAILGDSFNYWIGKYIGNRISRTGKLVKKEYLERTSNFYRKYGGKTIVLARFVPIIRTFAPFVAGLGKMDYKRFLAFNVVGGVAWVALFLFAGYYFGQLPFVQENLTIIILVIVFLSIIPVVIEYWKNRK